MQHTIHCTLSRVGIICSNRKNDDGSTSFYFNGTEEVFIQALEALCSRFGFGKQNEDWFPGDPGQCGDIEYFMCTKDKRDFCIDFNNRVISDLI